MGVKVERLRQNTYVNQKQKPNFWVDGWLDGWIDGWMDGCRNNIGPLCIRDPFGVPSRIQ